MNTPIFDYVSRYLNESPTRLHMPGHKGIGPLGFEERDITEISGADVLYDASGIIRESEENASRLFDSKRTLYATEGATLCIQAMVALVSFYKKGKKPTIAACRNAHVSFLRAATLCDTRICWINARNATLLSCLPEEDEIEALFHQKEKPDAVYLTTPDYLGNVLNVEKIAEICHKNGALLLVDNAHGSYLKFLGDKLHPLSQGADLVCDSAHKTLPVLTGGAYLHFGKSCPDETVLRGEEACKLFASTSPSYLILQSLDLCNKILSDHFSQKITAAAELVGELKKSLKRMGFMLCGTEPMKVTVMPKPYGYKGYELAKEMEKKGFIPEYSDPDHTVMMFSYRFSEEDLNRLLTFFQNLPMKNAVLEFPPALPHCKEIVSPRDAYFSPCRQVSAQDSEGMILARDGVSCPPAVPIVVCGERISKEAVACFSYYGIETIRVIE